MDSFVDPAMGYPWGPPLIFEDEFNQRSKQILGTLNKRNCGQRVLSRLWVPHILHTNFSKFHTRRWAFSLVKE